MAPPPVGGGTVSSNRNVMIVLSYLWLLAIVPLLTEKEDQEVQWHAKQGLALVVGEIAFAIVIWLASFVLSTILPAVGCFGCFLWVAIWALLLALHIMCIVKGVNGERFRVPVVADFAEKL